jgi:hypothetical protein
MASYEIGITVYGYIVVDASSRNDAAKVYDYSFDKILQEMKVNSIEIEHIKEVRQNVQQD